MPPNNKKKKSRFWKRQKDTVKSEQEIFQGGRNTDVIIPVMGKTGVGKSTFINTLLGKPKMKVGHEIVSCTATLQWEVVDSTLIDTICPGWGDRRVIIVDTPGFDDTFEDDSEILRRIAAWLGTSYAEDMKLGGIIYLQNIAERRMEGASRRNLEMFKKLCGTNALSRVILGTTSWQEVRPEIGEAREKELRTKFWKEMIENGSGVERFHLDQPSAFDIVRQILELGAAVPPAPPKIRTGLKNSPGHRKEEGVRIASETDVIIPVMGKTGVGKSTFINTLLGKQTMKVEHDIVSSSAGLQWEVIDPVLITKICPGWGDRRVVIVDTPGFDDTYRDNLDTLRRIGAWLASSYGEDAKLGGIIYLQNIADVRMDGSNRLNLEIFKKLCGPDALSRAVLATTRWQDVRPEVGEAREKDLTNKFWKELIDKKSTVARFDRTQASAFDILRRILQRYKEMQNEVVLRIQEELVDMKKHIPQTDAGQELLYSIEQVLEVHKQMQPDDDQEKEELLRRVQVLETQMKAMRLPFFTRLKLSFGL